MKRSELEHLLRAASRIADERDVLVVGSQAILGSIDESLLPGEAVASVELDVTFFHDPEDELSDLVDGAIGELSPFHEMYGYYAQGVSITTAKLPQGWRDRLVMVETAATQPARGHCLDPHDCVVAKLVAGREKDYLFASSLIKAGLIDPAVLRWRADLLDGVPPLIAGRVKTWIDGYLAASASRSDGDPSP